MRSRPLFWKLYPSYLAITLFTLFVAGWLVSDSLRQFYFQQVYHDLEAEAQLIGFTISSQGAKSPNASQLVQVCGDLAASISTHITVIDDSGRVLCDSEGAYHPHDNLSDRPEVLSAKRGQVGRAVRYSRQLNAEMVYVAWPIQHNGKVTAIVRTGLPLSVVDSAQMALLRNIISASLVVALLAAGLCLFVAKKISSPIEELARRVQQLPNAKGNHELLVPENPSREFVILAEAINSMVRELNSRMNTIEQQRSSLEAILSSMQEGVLVVNPHGHIVILNPAAANLLGIDFAKSKGQLFEELTREPTLQEIFKTVLLSRQAVEKQWKLARNPEKILRARATPLAPPDRHTLTGVLIILQDVTEFHRLDQVRRDFVANVSHELRTPLANIIGYAETLLDGNVDDEEQQRRFLQTILHHANRAARIVDDLLFLARLEQAEQSAQLASHPVSLRSIAESAVNVVGPSARTKNIQILVDVPAGLMIKAEPHLLEQALINLLDNAIKYSDPNLTVKLMAKASDREVEIVVEDQGCGIPPEHLSRIFERFYRVEKSRSRAMGGTGLGLAIVKHIAQLHGGRVRAESSVGKGSRFYVYLPLAS